MKSPTQASGPDGSSIQVAKQMGAVVPPHPARPILSLLPLLLRETTNPRSLSMPPSSALGKRNGGEGILAALSRSQVAAHGREAAAVAKKLLRSTGKAAWIAGTTFLVLVVPLIIEMDREQQINDIELQQQALLGGPPAPIK